MEKVAKLNLSTRWSQLKETLKLLGIGMKFHAGQFVEYLRVITRYYSNISFLKTDISVLITYFMNNPFHMSKEFLSQKGEKNIHTYGETPLTTLDKIVSTFNITAQDTVYELGCGRARTCFWLHYFVGCRVLGVDHLPKFVHNAEKIQKKFHLPHIKFAVENYFEMDLSGATVIYIYGTCLEDTEVNKLIEKLNTLPSGTKVITVSYPINVHFPSMKEIDPPKFEIMHRITAKYQWGETDVYLQQKI